MSGPRIVFAGTPAFALASLEALVRAGRAPVGVMTQPDRPAGRGRKLVPGPVRRYAEEQGIPVLQPRTLRDDDAVARFAAFEPDLLVVAAYGLLLPPSVLEVPPAGCVNVHASLLPRWRGAAPIQAAILAGDERTGVCLMRMTAGLDCGPVYACQATPIGPLETGGELHDRLATLGAGLLVRDLDAIIAGAVDPVEQDEAGATYAPKIGRDDARLDWSRAATELARQVRAYNPAPGAWFTLGDEAIKCWRATPVADRDGVPGEVVEAGREGVVVACGEGALRLDSLQRPGRRPITAQEFATQLEPAGRRL